MMERAIRAFVPDSFVAALASIVALHNREDPVQQIEQCERAAYADPYGSFMVLHILMSPTSGFWLRRALAPIARNPLFASSL